MAHATVRSGGQVINELTYSNHIVVAIRAKRGRINVSRVMTKNAATKSTGGMANTTILARRHVVTRFTARRNTMTGGAIVHDAGMIGAECWSETVGVVATSTIGARYRVGGHRGRLSACVNTIVIIVAISARL